MTSDNIPITTKLKEYQKICNDAIEKSRSAKIEGAINWGDSKCYETNYAINCDGDTCFQFFIDEADPDNEQFHDFLYKEILDNIPERAAIHIFTEW